MKKYVIFIILYDSVSILNHRLDGAGERQSISNGGSKEENEKQRQLRGWWE